MCGNNDIQTALPAYLEGSLNEAERLLVEGHLGLCADCTAELAMLRELAAQPVPDPGEAFWASLPGKVARDLREVEAHNRRRSLTGLVAGLALPRWVWAAAAVLVAALAAWYLAAPQDGTVRGILAKRGAAAQVRVVEQPASLKGVNPQDVARLSSWAHRELLAAQKELDEPVMDTAVIDPGIDDDLVALDQKQLDELVRKLKARGQEG